MLPAEKNAANVDCEYFHVVFTVPEEIASNR